MDCGDATHPAQITCAGTIVANLLSAALFLIGPFTIILIIIAGFRFIMSQGDSKQLESARKTLTFAIAGLAVVVFSGLIISVIASITGISCFKNLLDPNNLNNPAKTFFSACK